MRTGGAYDDSGEKMKTAFIVLDVMFAIGLLLTLLTGLPKLINYIRGCFGGRQKPLPKAKKKHRFAIIVPARNESAVIGKLLDSLDAQTFDVDHGDVFIAVESPDDPTCKIAADYGAELYFKKNFDRNGKGFVLEEVVDHIFTNRAYKNYEAFMIIDADNILEPDYIEKLERRLGGCRYGAYLYKIFALFKFRKIVKRTYRIAYGYLLLYQNGYRAFSRRLEMALTHRRRRTDDCCGNKRL